MVNQIVYSIFEVAKDGTKNVYIGSTKVSLRTRISKHKTDLKMYLGLTKKGSRDYRSSFNILVTDKYKVQTLDEIDTDDRKLLFELESKYIMKYQNDEDCNVVNRMIPNKETKNQKIDYSKLNNINWNANCEYNNKQYHYVNALDNE